MSEPGFASLGPSLLARKGGAKPAMRPQVAPLAESHVAIAEEQLEDLGWNDMGDSEPGSGADIVPIVAGMGGDGFGAEEGPVIHRQQRRLEARLLADAVMTGPEDREPEYDDEDEALYDEGYAEDDFAEGEDAEVGGYNPAYSQPEPVVARPTPKSRVPAMQSGRRAAFTLRLDADRHLKLRLAATMQGVSAQVLVTEALDRLLAEFDDLDVIATHLKRH
jgi:predicted HicB family RNase H-like nuclease